MKEKEKYFRALDESYSKKIKTYYSLKEIVLMLGISLRTAKYRMKVLKQKYGNHSNLIRIENRKWKIHHNLVNFFLPRYKTKGKPIFRTDWRSFGTLALRDYYDNDYFRKLIELLHNRISCKFCYAIETAGEDGKWHLHFISDIKEPQIVQSCLKKILSKIQIEPKEYRIVVNPIRKIFNAVTYIAKNGEVFMIT
jgi:hypothetical protein